jgi:hypothetical protein
MLSSGSELICVLCSRSADGIGSLGCKVPKSALSPLKLIWLLQHTDNLGLDHPSKSTSPVSLAAMIVSPSAKISVVMFTASGLLVRFLKVFEKSGYQSVKWVRYLSKANGSYQIRVSDPA